MQTEAIFENIAERIKREIDKAEKSIFIAVAWLTNRSLFDELVKKANSGCIISLIISNDRINEVSSINYDLLLINNSRVYKIGDGVKELMHNKFCIIDYSTVITGSYNWSYKAENNFENVIITYGDTFLASQFISEFDSIRRQYFPDESNREKPFPLNIIVRRLEILKNYLLLEDIEEINKEINKLKEYDFNTELKEIIFDLSMNEYSSAIIKIQDFISKKQQLTFWTNLEVEALKFEIKNLENKLIAFDNEKTELEKYLSDFHHRHTIELGDIILEILKLQKLKFKDDKIKYDEAENDERQYQEQFNEEKDKELFELTEEEKKLLKKVFRKAALLCHTDKFQHESLEIQKQAEEIFKELNEANSKNDLKRVNEILDNLEKGILKTSGGDKLTDKDKLRVTLNRLKAKIKTIEAEIIAIKESDTYRKLKNIKNWNEYFKKTKEKLQKELEELKLEF